MSTPFDFSFLPFKRSCSNSDQRRVDASLADSRRPATTVVFPCEAPTDHDCRAAVLLPRLSLGRAITADASDSDFGMSRTALRLGLAVFFSMNVMVFTMALWSWDTYAIATSDNAASQGTIAIACLLFATPVVLILGKPLVSSVATSCKIVSDDGFSSARGRRRGVRLFRGFSC